MTKLRNLANKILPSALQKAIRKQLYYRRLSKYPNRTTRHIVFGEELLIWLSDDIAEKWYDRDIQKLPFVDLLENRMFSGNGPVFYVGAHHGVYAAAISKMLGPHAKVVAVEANPEAYAVAKRVAEINKLDNLELVHRAISDKSGTIRFSLGHVVSSGQRGQPDITVPAGTIDDLTKEKGAPRLVIIDVEGYECFALEGALHTLDGRSDWCVEVHSGVGLERFGSNLAEVLSYFPSDQFSLYMARDFGSDSAVPFDISSPLVNERFHLIAMSKKFTAETQRASR